MDELNQLLSQGRRAEAVALARQAYDPSNVESQLRLAGVCLRAGEIEEATTLFEEALKPGIGNAQHWRFLAVLRGHRGDRPGEVEAITEAVRLAPTDVALRLHLTAALLDAGQRPEALTAAMATLTMQDTVEGRRLFVEAIQGTTRTDPELRAWLQRAVTEAWGRFHALFRTGLAVVRAGGRPLEEDELFGTMLVGGPISDVALEGELTALRRRYLLEGGGSPEFLQKLAAQADGNEYCWYVSPEEEAALEALAPDDPRRSLYEGPRDPILDEIPVLTPIGPGVSAIVRQMYEENPYPRWVRASAQAPVTLDVALRATYPQAKIDPVPGSEILVAGCGTGQHAIQVAQRYVGSQVLAIDLSRASLSYAWRKSAELGLTNISFGQADLMELGGLGRTFDAIECAGTLQALEDPFAGLKVLVGLLRPGGVMKIALYSRTAREELAPAMQLAKTFEPTPAGIRALRRAIVAAPEGDPVRAALGWSDFFSASTCRDLLMHVQEHQSEVADIRRMTDENGLRLIGFIVAPEVLLAYRRAYPADPAALDLDNWAAFEAHHPQIFRNMYQFWLQKPR